MITGVVPGCPGTAAPMVLRHLYIASYVCMGDASASLGPGETLLGRVRQRGVSGRNVSGKWVNGGGKREK